MVCSASFSSRAQGLSRGPAADAGLTGSPRPGAEPPACPWERCAVWVEAGVSHGQGHPCCRVPLPGQHGNHLSVALGSLVGGLCPDL